MRVPIPTPAYLLGLTILPLFGMLGALIGSWPIPLLLALLHGGWSEVSTMSLEWGFLPRVPDWIDTERGRAAAVLAWFAISAMMVVGMWKVGVLGGRLWGYLVVKRFKWMTEEEVQQFSEQEPPL